jgi:hypothetical protein
MAKHTETSAITGQDLLNLLELMTPEMLAKPVVFAFPAHDHWRNTLAGEVSDVEFGSIAYSQYHSKFQVLSEDQLERAQDRRTDAMSDEEGLTDEQLAEPLTYDNQPILDALVITM